MRSLYEHSWSNSQSFGKLKGYDFYELADILAENIRSWDWICPIAQWIDDIKIAPVDILGKNAGTLGMGAT